MIKHIQGVDTCKGDGGSPLSCKIQGRNSWVQVSHPSSSSHHQTQYYLHITRLNIIDMNIKVIIFNKHDKIQQKSTLQSKFDLALDVTLTTAVNFTYHFDAKKMLIW